MSVVLACPWFGASVRVPLPLALRPARGADDRTVEVMRRSRERARRAVSTMGPGTAIATAWPVDLERRQDTLLALLLVIEAAEQSLVRRIAADPQGPMASAVVELTHQYRAITRRAQGV